MAGQVVTWPFPAMGLYTELAPRHVPAEALSMCEDMYYPNAYSLRGRGTFDTWYTGFGGQGPANQYITRMYYWDRFGWLCWATNNAELHYTAAGTVLAGVAENVTDMVSFGVDATPALIVAEEDNGFHTLHTWDGTAGGYATLVGANVPRCRKLMVRFGRLFATRSPFFPSRVWWSDVGVATTWAGLIEEGGYIDVAPGQDGVIVEWIDFNGVLYIFKERALYRIIGDIPSTFVVQKVGPVMDVLAGTVVDCGDGVIYTTRHGVFVMGQTPYKDVPDISQRVQTDIKRQIGGVPLNRVAATYSPELQCYLLVASAGSATNWERKKAFWAANLANRPDVWTNFTLDEYPTCIYQANRLWLATIVITSVLGIQTQRMRIRRYTHDIWCGKSKFKTGYWDFGDKLPMKEIRSIQGPINARENKVVQVTLHPMYQGVEEDRHYTILINERNLERTLFNCEALAVTIDYRAEQVYRAASQSRSASVSGSHEASELKSRSKSGSRSASRQPSASRFRSASQCKSQSHSRSRHPSASQFGSISQSRSRLSESTARSASVSRSKWSISASKAGAP